MAGKPNTKWRETMIAKFGSEEAMLEWMRSNGARGGKISKGGGFGSEKIGKDGLTGRERAEKAGSIGGRNSRPSVKSEMYYEDTPKSSYFTSAIRKLKK